MTETASATVPVTDVEEYLKGIRFQEDDFEFQHMDEDLIDTNFASQSFWKDAYMRFKKNKGAVISFFCILLIILLAIVGPNMTPYTYATQDIKNQNQEFRDLRNSESWMEARRLRLPVWQRRSTNT